MKNLKTIFFLVTLLVVLLALFILFNAAAQTSPGGTGRVFRKATQAEVDTGLAVDAFVTPDLLDNTIDALIYGTNGPNGVRLDLTTDLVIPATALNTAKLVGNTNRYPSVSSVHANAGSGTTATVITNASTSGLFFLVRVTTGTGMLADTNIVVVNVGQTFTNPPAAIVTCQNAVTNSTTAAAALGVHADPSLATTTTITLCSGGTALGNTTTNTFGILLIGR